MTTSDLHEAKIVYPGDIKGRPTIELRIRADGTNEAFLVPTGGSPVPSGVSLQEKDGKYSLKCRIRKKLLKFKPEEVVRQKTLNWLIDDLGYSPDQWEVPVVMGGSVHDKLADVIVYEDASKETPGIIVEVKKPTRKEGIEQLKSYMNPTGAVFGYWSDGVDQKFLLRDESKRLQQTDLAVAGSFGNIARH